MVWIHINKKDMHITYNYYEHRPWFEYDNYHWALDMDSGSPHGHCQVVDNWNRPELPEGSKSRRVSFVSFDVFICFWSLTRGSKSARHAGSMLWVTRNVQAHVVTSRMSPLVMLAPY
jgi:hypothetical protein